MGPYPTLMLHVRRCAGTSDLVGQLVGALVSTALVFETTDAQYYDRLMSQALSLYGRRHAPPRQVLRRVPVRLRAAGARRRPARVPAAGHVSASARGLHMSAMSTLSSSAVRHRNWQALHSSPAMHGGF